MNKTLQLILIISLIGICIFVGFVVAGVIQQYVYPSTATGQTVGITIYLGDEEWINGTAINWGPVEANSQQYDYLNVKNTGQLSCTVTLHSTDLPTGWTQTWTANASTIAPNAWANGTLTLTTTTVEAITYNWNTIIRATQT